VVKGNGPRYEKTTPSVKSHWKVKSGALMVSGVRWGGAKEKRNSLACLETQTKISDQERGELKNEGGSPALDPRHI